MPSNYPLVSFITINYIHIKETISFLESAQRITYPNVEIIVVDNDSPTGKPTPELKEKFPNVHFIQSEKNLGFAGGNNLGIKAAKGDYYFLLNNDTILYPDFLEPIIDFIENHPDAGIASPKVLFEDERTIQYAGAIAINKYTGRGKRLGLMEQDSGQYDQCYRTDLGHGASLIVPKKIVDKVGLMPEIYFLYYEEHDWCEQIKRAGFSMYYLGISKIIHKESVTTGGDENPLKVFYMTRNRLLFMRRNSSGFPFAVGLLFFLLTSVPKHSLKYLLRRKITLFKAFYKGIGWNIVNWNLKS